MRLCWPLIHFIVTVQRLVIHTPSRQNKLFCYTLLILSWVTSIKQPTTVKVKIIHPTSPAGERKPTVMAAWHKMCHHNQKQPWCEKCEIATVTVTANVVMYRITSRPTEAEISVGVFLFSLLTLQARCQYICISVESEEAVKTKNLTMGAQYSKAYRLKTDNWPGGVPGG